MICVVLHTNLQSKIISHIISTMKKKFAGKDWVRGFRQRHPEMVLRVPEATSAARAQAFNKVNVTKFIDN